jgi:GxxExxY protein
VNDGELVGIILDAAFRIHTRLGPGLLESVYLRVFAYELTKEGLSVEVQKSVHIFYDEIHFEEGYRVDLIVENKILLELKSVEALGPVHVKQVLTYLRFAKIRIGYLINFGEAHLKTGIKRLVNG